MNLKCILSNKIPCVNNFLEKKRTIILIVELSETYPNFYKLSVHVSEHTCLIIHYMMHILMTENSSIWLRQTLCGVRGLWYYLPSLMQSSKSKRKFLISSIIFFCSVESLSSSHPSHVFNHIWKRFSNFLQASSSVH